MWSTDHIVESEMRHLHLEKPGIRGLAIAESFSQDSKKSVLSGIVMSTDLLIDGFVMGHSTVGGNDATDAILDMYKRLGRLDVNFILTSGIVISLHNIIDLKRISEETELPVIGVTYEVSDYDLGGGLRERVTLHTSDDLYIRNEGCTVLEAKQLLEKITPYGSLPEPLRISQLLANTLLKAKF